MIKKTKIEELPNCRGIIGWPFTLETDLCIYDRKHTWPKISIITPSYNQASFVEKTIRSILLQNYPNLEFILIDGGSTDGSVDIIKKYDPWIDFWVSEQDNGQADAINKGFSKASGEILAWLNTDDYYLPGALKAVALAYINNTDKAVQAWVGSADKINEKGELLYHAVPPLLTKESFFHWRNRKRPPNTGNFMQPACFFSRKAWEAAGPLRTDLHICLDVDLWLRMAEKFKFSVIDQKLAIAVGHQAAKTTVEVERSRIETALVIAEHGGRHIAQLDLIQLAEEHVQLKKRWKKLANSAPGRIYSIIKNLLR